MRVLIFTEGGSEIGLGHASRCSALYEEVINRDIDVQLIIYGNIENISILRRKNIFNINWLSEDFLSSYICKEDYCIVDSYLATEKMYQTISQRAKVALYIDDYNRIKYPKGIIINPSLWGEELAYTQNKDIKLLLGSKYIIFREPFKKQVRSIINNEVKNVLITMGGSDIRGLTPLIIDEICSRYINITFYIVIGGSFNNVEQIEIKKPHNVIFYYNVDAEKMKNIMTKSDFAITAAGQTIYELMATQTPFVPIKIAENQKNNYRIIQELGLVKKGMEYNSYTIKEDLIDSFEELLDKKTRTTLVNNYRKIIDGLGSRRIIDVLLNEKDVQLDFKKANKNHCELLYKWVNDKDVRKNSFSTNFIEYEKHKNGSKKN